jgi:hypothetical protein
MFKPEVNVNREKPNKMVELMQRQELSDESISDGTPFKDDAAMVTHKLTLTRGDRKTGAIEPAENHFTAIENRYVIGPDKNERVTKYAISAEFLDRCLEPIQCLYTREKIRVIVRLPHVVTVRDKDDKEREVVDYNMSHSTKYLVMLSREFIRTGQQFLEFLVDKFKLPATIKTDSVLVNER